MRFRYESFGGIVALDDPPLLAYVDRALARRMGYPDHSSWQGAEDLEAPLSAPTEIHMLLTGRCPARCGYCYADSGPDASPGLELSQVKVTLEALARLNVFHVALGGGESLLREDIFVVARHARALGLTPNLTTSGMMMTQEIAAKCTIFGQVNVSMDGLGAIHRKSRGDTSFKGADRALRLLLKAGVATGINTVLTRASFEGLDGLVAYAAELGANEVELL